MAMVSTGRSSLVGLCGLPLFAVVLFATGCNRKDEAQCQEALGHTRDAIKVENTQLARQWRTYSYGQCADATALQALDREIQAKEAEIAKRASDAAARKAEQQQLVDVFKQWVAQNRTSAESAGVTVVCEHDDDEKLKKSKKRFCTRTRGIGGGKYRFEVRYWEGGAVHVQAPPAGHVRRARRRHHGQGVAGSRYDRRNGVTQTLLAHRWRSQWNARPRDPRRSRQPVRIQRAVPDARCRILGQAQPVARSVGWLGQASGPR